MHYVYEYAIMSSVFLAIIVIMFFSKRQFPNRRNLIFAVILVCAIADVLLDIVSSVLIENCAFVAPWITYTLNTLFYMLQCAFPLLMFIYVMIASKTFLTSKKLLALFMFPAAVAMLFFVFNPFTHYMFYITSAGEYVHAPGFIFSFIVPGFYILLSAVYLIRYRKNVSSKEFHTTFAGILIITASVALQLYTQRVMLTSAGMTVAITMMYLIMQKPEDMLDGMTNAFTREAMFLLISDLCEMKKPYRMMTAELHNLRRINRIFGMSFGNKLITEMSDIITKNSTEGWVFRFLGNVFVLITLDAKAHDENFNNVARALNEPCDIEGMETKLYTTVCCIESTEDISDADEACNMIETVVSEAKRGMQNIINVDMIRDMERRNKVESELMKAIARESFEVYYQPIYSLKTNSFDSAEALVRFCPQGMGSISPAEFIPIAEKQGVVADIDAIVLKKVCAFIKQTDPAVTLGIKRFELNLSPAEFINNDLSERVIQTVKQSGVDPSCILFEITETVAVSEFDSLHSNIDSLKEAGFGFVLDDYGTGYSNVSMLMNLPFSTIKLDRSMLTSAMAIEQNRVIFEKTVNMFEQLKIGTVVEGVETDDEAEFVRGCGADKIQGYYYAMPMLWDDLIRFMKKESFMV